MPTPKSKSKLCAVCANDLNCRQALARQLQTVSLAQFAVRVRRFRDTAVAQEKHVGNIWFSSAQQTQQQQQQQPNRKNSFGSTYKHNKHHHCLMCGGHNNARSMYAEVTPPPASDTWSTQITPCIYVQMIIIAEPNIGNNGWHPSQGPLTHERAFTHKGTHTHVYAHIRSHNSFSFNPNIPQNVIKT